MSHSIYGTVSSLSLIGNNTINENNLTGKSMFYETCIEPYYVVKIKTVIFNRFITPIFSNNWKVVEQNMFSLPDIRKKVDMYVKESDRYGLDVYLSFLDVVVHLLAEHNYYERLENMYHPKNTIGTIRFKMPQIRLQPEYELYKLIFGKPKRSSNGETYHKEKLEFIRNTLRRDFMEFSEIKRIVLDRFP